MTDEKKSLVAKLAEACDAVGGVDKKGRNQQQGYDYQRATDVAKAIRHELFSRGVVVVPDELEPEWVELTTKSGAVMTECRLTTIFTVTDGNETLKYNANAVARDSGDKAIYKAKTGALKYFLRGLGLIPDEADDPEHDEKGSVENQQAIAKRKIKELSTSSGAPCPAREVAAPERGVSLPPFAGTPQVTQRNVDTKGNTYHERFENEAKTGGEARMLVQSVKEATKADGTTFVFVEWATGQSYTCFDKKLFPRLSEYQFGKMVLNVFFEMKLGKKDKKMHYNIVRIVEDAITESQENLDAEPTETQQFDSLGGAQ